MRTERRPLAMFDRSRHLIECNGDGQMRRTAVCALCVALLASPAAWATHPTINVQGELVAIYADKAPNIDGVASENIWARAQALVTHDPRAATDLTIRAVYTDDRVYILARFPDPDENRTHKTQVWVPDQDRYRTGTDREDTFVIKWSMAPGSVDLRVDADRPYKADIWFWKAHRTDPSGYADDKMHIYSAIEGPNSRTVISKRGLRFFLNRPGDAGKSAYKTMVPAERNGDTMPFYAPRQPEGSRADVRAKGIWRDGAWTIEFSRPLVTNNSDDIQFHIDQVYQFGVSRYEIAGRKRNPKLDQPWYGAGEITGPLSLRFQHRSVANR